MKRKQGELVHFEAFNNEQDRNKYAAQWRPAKDVTVRTARRYVRFDNVKHPVYVYVVRRRLPPKERPVQGKSLSKDLNTLGATLGKLL